MKYLLVIFFILFVSSLSGQHNHNGESEAKNEKPLFDHTPTHGGEIVMAGKYKLEVVIDAMNKEEKVTVYLLKNNDKQIRLDKSKGYVILKYKEAQTDSLGLIKSGDKFVVDSIDLTKKVNIIFYLEIKNYKTVGTYYHKGLIKR
ncbi:MAG: hypothetical protein Q8L81_01995 [Bacteroidota bacterium]|nr:hypothetical protein [Bacteroidota bacterium]